MSLTLTAILPVLNPMPTATSRPKEWQPQGAARWARAPHGSDGDAAGATANL